MLHQTIHQAPSTPPVAVERSIKQNSSEDLALASEYLQLRTGLQALRKGCEGAAQKLEQVALASDKATFESQAGSQQQEELTAARKRAVKELAAARARAAAEASVASELVTLRSELVQERAECGAVVEAAALAHTRELAHREETQAERLLLRTELEEASSVSCFLHDALDTQVSQREELLVASRENHAAMVAEHGAVVESLHRDLSEAAARAVEAKAKETVAVQTDTVETALMRQGSLAGRAWRQRRRNIVERAAAEEPTVTTLSVVPGCCLDQDLTLQPPLPPPGSPPSSSMQQSRGSIACSLFPEKLDQDVRTQPPLPPPVSPPSSSMQQNFGSIAFGPLHEEFLRLQAAACTAQSEVAVVRAEFDAASKAEARALFAVLDEAEVAAGLRMDLERERARHEYTIGVVQSTEARWRAELAAATVDAPSPRWRPSEELWWAGAAPEAEPPQHSIGGSSALRSRPHRAWWPWHWT